MSQILKPKSSVWIRIMRGSLDSGDGGAAGLSPCVSAPRNKKRFPGRWSIRHLIYSSPLARRRSSGSGVGTSTKVYRKVEPNNPGTFLLSNPSCCIISFFLRWHKVMSFNNWSRFVSRFASINLRWKLKISILITRLWNDSYK